MELSAFKQLFGQYYDQIKNYLYYKTGDISLAEDLAQELFIKLWEKRNDIQEDTVKSLIYTIANNLTINHFKSGKVRYEFGLKADNDGQLVSETPQFIMEKNEFEVQLESAISELEEGQRLVFLMNRIDSLTYKEIAVRLDISVKAVEKRMSKALFSLKQKLDKNL